MDCVSRCMLSMHVEGMDIPLQTWAEFDMYLHDVLHASIQHTVALPHYTCRALLRS